MITEKAPAKINLTLEVLGKRPDGYHEVRSVMQAVGLFDTLTFEMAEETVIRSNLPGWSAEKSLVSKAVYLVKEVTGTHREVDIKIDKCIPLMSGLGGDSSDTAAVLHGLNQLWQLDLSSEELDEMAGQLGSDVFFSLHGGTALVEGRGEQITPLKPLTKLWVVLVVPDVGRNPGKTAAMYRGLQSLHFTDGEITGNLVKAIEAQGKIEMSMLFNTFENIAFEDSQINAYRGHLIKMGAPHVHLAGSGPALFTVFREQSLAQELLSLCENQGMKTYLVETL